MAFDPTLADPISRMRHAVGDTGDTPLEPDATYQAVLTQHGEELGVAVIAQGLAVRYAQRPSSFTTDEGQFTWADRVRTWLSLVDRVRKERGVVGGAGAGSFVIVREKDEGGEYVRPENTGYGWWTE